MVGDQHQYSLAGELSGETFFKCSADCFGREQPGGGICLSREVVYSRSSNSAVGGEPTIDRYNYSGDQG